MRIVHHVEGKRYEIGFARHNSFLLLSMEEVARLLNAIDDDTKVAGEEPSLIREMSRRFDYCTL